MKSDILNEAFICTKLTNEATPCELSSQLLIRLREILKTYANSPAGEKFSKKVSTTVLKVSDFTRQTSSSFFILVFLIVLVENIFANVAGSTNSFGLQEI
jgi:hypothetical protein